MGPSQIGWNCILLLVVACTSRTGVRSFFAHYFDATRTQKMSLYLSQLSKKYEFPKYAIGSYADYPAIGAKNKQLLLVVHFPRFPLNNWDKGG